jgi:hypothetical protein
MTKILEHLLLKITESIAKDDREDTLLYHEILSDYCTENMILIANERVFQTLAKSTEYLLSKGYKITVQPS